MITFRTFVRADYPLLEKWRRDTAWQRWWGPSKTLDELEEDYGPTIDGAEPTVMLVAEEDGSAVGLVETYRLADYPAWNREIAIASAAGIDFGIGSPHNRGRGLGKHLVTYLIQEAFDTFPECSEVVAVPKTSNVGSCRSVESAGMHVDRVAHIAGEWPTEGTSSVYRISRSLWENSRRHP